MNNPSHDIAHGYTLADLDTIARHAVKAARGKGGSYRDRYQTAWSAIAETLCAATDRPEPRALREAGWNAVNRLVDDRRRHSGRAPGGAVRPSFARYWTPVHSPSIEDRVIESVALRDILTTLTPQQRRAVTALACTGNDHQAAASMLGLTAGGFKALLNRARASFLEMWHEGETPSRHWRRDYSAAGRRAEKGDR